MKLKLNSKCLGFRVAPSPLKTGESNVLNFIISWTSFLLGLFFGFGNTNTKTLLYYLEIKMETQYMFTYNV